MASEYSDLLNKHFAGEHVVREDGEEQEEEDEEAWLSDAVKGLEGKGLDEVQGLQKGELIIQLNDPPAVPALTKRAAGK